jgi:hypothetical protein
MNYKIELIKDLFNIGELSLADGKLVHRDLDTGVETILAVESGESNALPKEVAIMHGFEPELNEHGGRRNAYADSELNRLRNSSDENERKAVEYLPKWFVFEDELNNPAPGTLERATLNRNDDQAAANAMVGNKVILWQGADGVVVKDHVYLRLGNSRDQAVKKLSEFNKLFDKLVRRQIAYVTNNSRI